MHTEENCSASDLGDVLEWGFWCCRTTTNNDREPLMQQMFIFNMKIFWQLCRYLVMRYFGSTSRLTCTWIFPNTFETTSEIFQNNTAFIFAFYLIGQWATSLVFPFLRVCSLQQFCPRCTVRLAWLLSQSWWALAYRCDPTERSTLQTTSFSFLSRGRITYLPPAFI